MSFLDLRLAEPIVRAVAAEGYTSPTPIQAQAIPVALEGRDVLGCAQTGTGKTCAFALPILHRLANLDANGKAHKGAQGRAPRALVLCPTRELASQIFDSFASYGRFLPLRHTVVFGGVNQHRQVQAMRAGVDVLIATPGRLIDLINQGHIDLSAVETLVLDEADRMLDMGFIPDIRKVVKMIREDRQTLLFSATMSPEIRKLADSILTNPVSIQTVRESTTADSIAQRVYMVERNNKAQILEQIIKHDDTGRTLVFTRTKHGADKLVKTLRRAEIRAEAIHGNKSQNARTRAMQDFRSGRTTVLVATDIASRGIDVDEITHVFNYDMPVDAETYVHRIGRTARAGASGVAISLCDRDEIKILRSIERRTKASIEVGKDFEELTIAGPVEPTGDRSGSRSFRKPYRGGPRSGGGNNAGGGGGRGPRGRGGQNDGGPKRDGARVGGRSGGRPAGKPGAGAGKKTGSRKQRPSAAAH
jgi:ATP-dependent RNA helicase RhlE